MSLNHFKKGHEGIEEVVTASLVEGYLPCSVALRISAHLQIEPRWVGETANRLKIRITDCLLGCFKIKKSDHGDLEEKHFARDLIEAVQNALVDGRLPCRVAHDLGRRFKVSFKEIGDAATKMKIKISDCQLGCFS